MSAPEFTDAEFWRSHMRAPRGHGCWAFQASRTPVAFEGDRSGEIVWASGTLTEAKRTVRTDPRFEGVAYIAILP